MTRKQSTKEHEAFTMLRCRCGWIGDYDDAIQRFEGRHPSGLGPELVRLACPECDRTLSS